MKILKLLCSVLQSLELQGSSFLLLKGSSTDVDNWDEMKTAGARSPGERLGSWSCLPASLGIGTPGQVLYRGHVI